MSIQDPLVHPALLDPRQWGEVNLYQLTPPLEREPLTGAEQHAPDRRFDLRHLRLELRFDEEQETVSGSAVLTLTPFADGFTHFELDAAEMSISRVSLIREEAKAQTVSGDGVSQTADAPSLAAATALSFETFQEKIGIELDRAYARGEALTVEIVYACRPRKGLFFVKPDDAYPRKPRQIWSQGETEDAHWWFPCCDTPQQKMTTELRATVKENCFALSNGTLAEVRENPAEQTRTYHWRQEQPHPAYLMTVVVGEYTHIQEHLDGLPVDYYLYSDRQEEGRRLFANTPRMIEFFAARFGHPYPYPKYAQVLVEDFPIGAMENTSATTLTDRVLLDERAAIDLNYDDIVAHELAHQWWGDLVTCKHWSQIWLNESFATYAETLWRERTQGHDEARFALFQDFLVYLREDQTSHRRPIVFNRYHYSEELLDRHAYEKGACVVDMLRSLLGDDAFFRSLAHYLKKFAFGVAETNDLKVAIEEATGRNLHWFFEQWLYRAGYPELEVAYEWQREQKMLRLSVKQTQQEADKDAPCFRLPVEIEIVTAEAGEVIETERRARYRVVVEKAEQDFYFPCESKPRLVVFDKGHRIFKLMRFPKSAQELIYQLTHEDDVLGRVRAARELSAFKGEETVQALRGALTGEDFWAVRMSAALSLGEIGGDGARAALIAAYRAERQARVRRGCLVALGHFKDDAAVDCLREALDRDESYFVAVAAARALANIGTDRAYDILCASLPRNSWQEVIRSAVFHGLAQAKEKRALELALTHSRYGEHPAARVAAIACLGALGKELHKEQADERVTDRLIELLHDKSMRARTAAVRALGRVGNPRALGPLREAQTRECLDQLRSALREAIEGLEKKVSGVR
jgi:aminopeptidase N